MPLKTPVTIRHSVTDATPQHPPPTTQHTFSPLPIFSLAIPPISVILSLSPVTTNQLAPGYTTMVSDRNSNLSDRNDLKGKGRGRKGIGKALAYLSRVFCVEYDFNGAIEAYGVDFCHYLLDEIAAGRVNCKQNVERWSAHKALHNVPFASVRSDYENNDSLPV